MLQFVQEWSRAGATNAARSILNGRGWELRLCSRVRVVVWGIAATYAAMVFALIFQASPQRSGWSILASHAGYEVLVLYCVGFMTRYRVQVDEAGLRLHRFLRWTRKIAWSEVTGFSLTPDETTVRLVLSNGKTLDLRTALDGLSAVRRCLAAYATDQQIASQVWFDNDAILYDKVPSWRCDPEDLEVDPFLPLGSWQDVHSDEIWSPTS